MSSMQFQETINITSADVQIWENSASDDGGSSKFTIFNNPEVNFDSVSGKENQGPTSKNLILSNSSTSNEPFKPVNTYGLMEKSRIQKGFRDLEETKIDNEINEIESKISRLSSRLEALRLEKSERRVVKRVEFVERNESSTEKKIEEIINSSLSARTKVCRRGMSMGPSEIVSAKGFWKQEMIITPGSNWNRRKSCSWKLQDVKEVKVVCKEKVAAKTGNSSCQAAITVSSGKVVKKEDGCVVNSVLHKKLSKNGEKSAPVADKKAWKAVRVVASRYNQNMNHVDGDMKVCDKERSLLYGKSCIDSKSLGTERRKQWEIPSDVVVHGNVEDEKLLEVIVAVPDLLPRIRIARSTNESPRDSGPAKRVAELIGRKSYFAEDKEIDASICQALK